MTTPKLGAVLTGAEYVAALARLGFSLASAGRFFRVNVRTALEWGKAGPPAPVAVAVLLMLGAELDAEAAMEAVALGGERHARARRPKIRRPR